MPQPNYGAIMTALKKVYTEPAASDKATPWETLFFTMLSARSKDERTEIAFQEVMKRYPGPYDLAKAWPSDVARLLKKIGLYKNKSRLAVDMAKAVVRDYGGKIPDDLDELVKLPGVGRKTASCVLVYSFGIPAIAVDTHVHRIANRLGWVKTDSPEKTERALRDRLPQKYWLDINRLLVLHGRKTCQPRKPQCMHCPVRQHCKFPNKTPPKNIDSP